MFWFSVARRGGAIHRRSVVRVLLREREREKERERERESKRKSMCCAQLYNEI